MHAVLWQARHPPCPVFYIIILPFTIGQRGATGNPGATHNPPPPQPAECRRLAKGRRPCGPPPGQGRPPPPLRPEGAAAPDAERHWVHAPRAPGPSPVRSQSGLGKPQCLPACQPARRPPVDTQGRPPDRARTGAHGHGPEQYGDHTLHGLDDAAEARLAACSKEAERRTEAEGPPAPRPPGPLDERGPSHVRRGGGKRTAPPPTPQAPDHLGRTDPPTRGRTTGPQARGRRDRATPQELNRRSTGQGQETRKGTNRLERPYRRPAPKPREVRAPHRPGGGARTPQEQERTHTQRRRSADPKGNQTEPADRTDGMEWPTGRRKEGTPGQDSPQHAPRGTQGQGGAQKNKRELAPARSPQVLPRAPRTHDQGTAPAKAVLAHSATHQRRG